jgi:hypothetical protein
MNVGELRHMLGEQTLWVRPDHEVLVEVRMPDGTVIPCSVAGFQSTMTSGPHETVENFVLIATPFG